MRYQDPQLHNRDRLKCLHTGGREHTTKSFNTSLLSTAPTLELDSKGTKNVWTPGYDIVP